MKALGFTALATALVFATHPAKAEPQTKKMEIGVGLGFGLPFGSLEQASKISDTTYGLVPLSLDIAYRYVKPLSAFARVSYAVGIPKLCASGSDCRASLGSDAVVALGSRAHLPMLGPLRPFVDFGFGYEWYGSTLSDRGVSSSRSYRGPIFLLLDAGADFRVTDAVRIGPMLATGFGSYAHATLDTPAFKDDGPARGAGLHGFVEVLARASVAF